MTYLTLRLRSCYVLAGLLILLAAPAQCQSEDRSPDSAVAAATDTAKATADSVAEDVDDRLDESVRLQAMEADPEDRPPFQDSAFATPFHTIWTHYYYTHDTNTNPIEAGKALFPLKGLDREELGRRAQMLQQFREGKGIYIFEEDLPRDPNYVDTTKGGHRYLLSPDYPQIYLKKYGDKWLYSRETVEKIPKLYYSIYPLGLNKLLDARPDWMNSEVLGIALWQVLYVIALALLAWLVHRLQVVIFRVIVDRVIIKLYKAHFDAKTLDPVLRPLSIFIVIQVVAIFLPALQMNPIMAKYVQLTLKIVQPLLIIATLYRLMNLVAAVAMKLAEKTESTLDDQLIPLLKKLMQVIIVLVGTGYIIHNLNYDVTALIAGLSIGGLALAFAAQDTLKNFFGSILIFLDRPFQVGDYIVYGEIVGTVEQVDMRSTRIRTFEDSLVYVPNGQLADSAVNNYGLRTYRRFFTNLGLQYDTPPDLIEAYIDGLRQLVAEHPATRGIPEMHFINLNSFADSSINIMFYVFFDVADWRQELEAREDMMLGAIRLAERLNVQFAFPTQTIHVENFPGQESLSAKYEHTKASARGEVTKVLEEYRPDWNKQFPKPAGAPEGEDEAES